MAARTPTPENRTRVRDFILSYMAANGGKRPTSREIQSGIGMSPNDVQLYMNDIFADIDEYEARKRAAPETPEAVHDLANRMTEELWHCASEMATAGLRELQKALSDERALAAANQAHLAEELTTVLDLVEEKDLALSAAAAREQELLSRIADLEKKVDEGNARQSERDAILDLLNRGRLNDLPDTGKGATTKPRSSGSASADAEPELPMA